MAGFRILSLDGGGAWALIQVKTLIDLYSRAGDGSDIAGHEILRKFDLVAANSGGALTLGGLIKNWTLAQLLDLFMTEADRNKIFVPATVLQDPDMIVTRPLGLGPKYHTKSKLEGIRELLGGADADRLVSDVPSFVGAGAGGRQPQVLFCAFDYDLNREVFFRSDRNSLTGSIGGQRETNVAMAVHASANPPIRYFDEPAVAPGPAGGPKRLRYWDGAVGGYNNPVLAATIEALGNCARYNTSRDEIRALSIGTGNVVLPLTKDDPMEYPELVAQQRSSGTFTDIRKITGAILDDPPDAATFHAHVMLGGKLPSSVDPLPAQSPVLRLNPLVQPLPGAGQRPWTYPPGLPDHDRFKTMADMPMDAVRADQVDAIEKFCEAWLADGVPNQPVRANSATLAPEIGFGWFSAARPVALRTFS
jgi:hypothetical protein